MTKLPHKNKDRRKKEEERHDDKTPTNGRFETNPTVVVLGYSTPLTSSIKH